MQYCNNCKSKDKVTAAEHRTSSCCSCCRLPAILETSLLFSSLGCRFKQKRMLLALAVVLLVLGTLGCCLSYSGAGAFDPRQAVANAISEVQEHGRDDVDVDVWPAYTRDEGVLFLKTHKTASSTLTAILWRNLCAAPAPLQGQGGSIGGRNCFLPPASHPGKTWDLSLSRDLAAVKSGAGTGDTTTGYPFSAWISHARYSPSLFDVVPSASRMISVVRRPALRFRSAWAWYGHGPALHSTLADFAQKYSSSSVAEAGGSLRGEAPSPPPPPVKFKYRTGLDATTEELLGVEGFVNANRWRQRWHFEHLLQRVLSGKLVLLVADRFDESLLALGHLLGWDHHRLLYSRLKVGGGSGSGGGGEAMEDLSAETLRQLDALQPFDSALWALANHMLDKYIHIHFPDQEAFQLQVREFRQLNDKFNAECQVVRSLPDQGDVTKKSLCDALFRDNSDTVKHAWSTKM